jgi:hypothetical protein
MAWEHREISNASIRGGVAAELDPLGMNAGLINPFPLPSTRRPLEAARTYPGFSDLSRGQCVVDDIDTPCEAITGEATVQCPPAGCHSLNLRTNRIEDFHAYADRYAGYVSAEDAYAGNGHYTNPADDEYNKYAKLYGLPLYYAGRLGPQEWALRK